MFKKGYTTINFMVEKVFISRGTWGIREYFNLKSKGNVLFSFRNYQIIRCFFIICYGIDFKTFWREVL